MASTPFIANLLREDLLWGTVVSILGVGLFYLVLRYVDPWIDSKWRKKNGLRP